MGEEERKGRRGRRTSRNKLGDVWGKGGFQFVVRFKEAETQTS